jgi:hypothetical protein
MAAGGRLPLWVWLLPLSTSIAAVVAWTAWCNTSDGNLLGGVLIAASGLLVFSLSLESLAHRGGLRDVLRRTGIALGLGGRSSGGRVPRSRARPRAALPDPVRLTTRASAESGKTR